MEMVEIIPIQQVGVNHTPAYMALRGRATYQSDVNPNCWTLRWIFIAINGQGGYNSKVAELFDLLVADLNHNKIHLSNQAFAFLEWHRNTYIAKRGHNIYLTIIAKFLNKQRGRESYNSKLAGFLDNLLEVHHDDINFINQSFDMLEWHKVAYLATKGPISYKSKVAEVVDRLLAGAFDHDDDEVIIDEFNLLKCH